MLIKNKFTLVYADGHKTILPDLDGVNFIEKTPLYIIGPSGGRFYFSQKKHK